MIVTVENRKFSIVFTKEKSKHRDGKEKINTICRIYVLEQEGKRLVGEGRALLNYRDKYNKIVGKKIALTRALVFSKMSFCFHDPVYPRKSKKRRTIVWGAFNKQFRNGKVKR